MEIRPIRAGDRAWLRDLLVERWGALRTVSRGRIHYPDRLDGFVAEEGATPVGFLTYAVADGEMEIVAVAALVERRGIGRRLVEAALGTARRRSCRRLWLVTTNDNMPAQAFYESVGFRLVAIHEGAVDEGRRLKPEIPRYGVGDVEIRDEIEYEIALSGSDAAS